MAKRPRRSYSLESRLRRIIASDPSLAAPGSSAEDVAHAIRSRRREHRRYSLEVFTAAVRRALASLPHPSSSSADDSASSSSGHEAVTTSSSSYAQSGPADDEPPADVTKSLLRSRYSSQTTSKRPREDPAATGARQQQVESEVTANTEEAAEGGGYSYTQGGGGKGPMFADLGGMEAVIQKLRMRVVVPLHHPELLRWLGVRPITGILLHGPPGCGKTTLAHAIANETGVPFYNTSATDLVSGVSGGSEENIRALFSKAYRTAPSIVFIDEIDAIASKREEAQRGMERRIVTQLITCMDEFHQNIAGSNNGTVASANDMDTSQSSGEKKPPAEGYVIVIGATNRPDALDQALRRPGRFDLEIPIPVPDENARRRILERLTQSLRLPPEGGSQFDLGKMARATPGFVGADLKALVDQAGSQALERIVGAWTDGDMKQYRQREPLKEHEMESLSVTMDDFEKARKEVQPSLGREGLSSVPDVTWADVGGLDSLREELHRCIVRCIKHPECYEKFGVDMQAGFLLFGPPGCGKTLIAKAVAHEAGANFIHIKGPEVLNLYVGNSESHVRKIFSRARMNSPCIIFFDEVDALTTKRGKEGAWVVERIVNTLLNELDGAGQRQGVFVIGATNRIDVVDDALLRPGRFGKKHFVPLPGANERASILKSLVRAGNIPVSSGVNLDTFAHREKCNNLSGADLASLVSEAAMAALEESLKSNKNLFCNGALKPSIEISHFEQALSKVKPSVSEQQRKYHEALSKKYSSN
uniref:Uncharacterized protein n=1 Tax=Avena sativa TaxID=4498 RepID=A0ACD5YYG8_AVESA